MMDLKNLYQEVIIDHSRHPRNYCDDTTKVCKTNHQAEGFNPLCGDKLTLYLTIDNDIVKDACFHGSGCAISTASASLMTEAIKNKTIIEVQQLFKKFHHLLTKDSEVDDLGKLEVLSGVRKFPMRVKCATLAWHTLQAALENTHEAVTTE